MKTIVEVAQNLIKPFINSEDKKYAANIAPVETSPATAAHTAGTQLIYNGVLYDVTADIAIDDPLATTGAGANIAVADKVTEQISSQKQALADEVETRATLGAHNLMPYDLATIKKLNTTGTWNNNVYTLGNLTFTVNSDLSITVNGTNGSSDVYLYLTNPNNYVARDWGGKKLSGATGGSNTTYRMYITASNNGTSWAADISQYDDEIIIGSYPYYGSARIMISANAVLSNVVFKPMIRLASDSDSTYQPYAMTNKELTDYVTPKRGTFSWNGATFKYCLNSSFMTISSTGEFTTEPTNDSSWSLIDTIENPYGATLYGTLVLNKGSIYKLRLAQNGELAYIRIVAGSGVGLYIQDTCVISGS